MNQPIKKQDQVTNFWFGFSLGIIACATGLYFFGTKKGRETLKNILDFTENLEENLNQIIQEIEQNQQLPKNDKKITSSINNVIDKVKTFVAS